MSNVRKCEICGNVVTIVRDAGVPLHCCGAPMKVEEVHSGDEGFEKHKPVVEHVEGGVTVKVGSVEHPMLEAHSILFVQLIKDGKIIAGRQFSPGEKPEAFFAIEGDDYKARAYCDTHGLWEN